MEFIRERAVERRPGAKNSDSSGVKVFEFDYHCYMLLFFSFATFHKLGGKNKHKVVGVQNVLKFNSIDGNPSPKNPAVKFVRN